MNPEALQSLSFGSNNKLVDLLREIITNYKQSTAGKTLTVEEAVKLLMRAATGITGVVLENFPSNSSDAAKLKAQILEAVGVFYDEVIAPIDIKGIPNLVEGWVDRFCRGFALDLASGLVEQLLALLASKPQQPDGEQDSSDTDQAQPLHNVIGSDRVSSSLIFRMREFEEPA